MISKEEERFNGQVSIATQNIDLENLKAMSEITDNFPSGKATFTIDASAPMTTWASMTRTATGTTSLRINGGSTRGFGIARLLRPETSEQFFALSIGELETETFDKLELEGSFTDGIISIKNAVIDKVAGKVAFTGVAPFQSGGIALTATASPNQQKDGASERRFFVGGTWNKPFATPLLVPSATKFLPKRPR
ncbi:MAG: AsmA-like C-terminal region-containing protein [Ahrensia sp.]|nr:AsmA-like C-terminal region-containing protein [Ahrensia sp.]